MLEGIEKLENKAIKISKERESKCGAIVKVTVEIERLVQGSGVEPLNTLTNITDDILHYEVPAILPDKIETLKKESDG